VAGRGDAHGLLAASQARVPVLAGVASGLEVLIKINTGATVAVLAAARDPLQRLAGVAQGRGFRRVVRADLAIAWFAAGQGLANIGPYVSTARQVISGWSTAMQLVGPNAVLWAALVVAIAVFVIGVAVDDVGSTRRSRGDPADLAGARILGLQGGVRGSGTGPREHLLRTALGAVIAFSWRGAQRAAVLWGLTLVVAIWFMVISRVRCSTSTRRRAPGSGQRDLHDGQRRQPRPAGGPVARPRWSRHMGSMPRRWLSSPVIRSTWCPASRAFCGLRTEVDTDAGV